MVVNDRFGDHTINLYSRDWEVTDFIQVVDQEKFINYAQNFYDKDCKRIGFTPECSIGDIDEKPVLLEKMIYLAESLAAKFTFMRIDFYTIGFAIYFGELTPCPGGGLVGYNPIKYDRVFGNKWQDHSSLAIE